ncbi:MAG: RNA polymerase sigma factor [Patescibacteria group bacterium]|nr:RNA polymerase sigma factor [Patescibacteria group bacterium]MDD5490740.1 RNA polymerase sigma factor [Patescibacteria group bacterium]
MKTLNKFKEKFLLFRIRTRGDKEAYGELYDNYVASIYRFIYFKVSSRSEAEDLTSETFLKTWDYLADQEKSSRIETFGPFIYRVARNLVVDYYRNRIEETALEGIESSTEKMDLKTNMELDEQVREIEEGMKDLKEEYREVILLKYIEGLGISEIAEIIDKTKGSTRVLLHRAVKALKEVVKE